ncbi:22539_t:CDS:2, partial [Racocetra persica]
MNNQDPDARDILYTDFPLYYIWNKTIRSWKRRQREGCIGRIYMAYPCEGKHSKTVSDFDLLELVPEINTEELPDLVIQELDYQFAPDDLAKANTLNEGQRAIFNEV